MFTHIHSRILDLVKYGNILTPLKVEWKSKIGFIHILVVVYSKQKTRPEADCGSYHQFLNANFRLKLKKVGNTTRPFRYDLNQIPYDYIAEVMNKLKGLDLVNRVPEELWKEVHTIVQEGDGD